MQAIQQKRQRIQDIKTDPVYKKLITNTSRNPSEEKSLEKFRIRIKNLESEISCELKNLPESEKLKPITIPKQSNRPRPAPENPAIKKRLNNKPLTQQTKNKNTIINQSKPRTSKKLNVQASDMDKKNWLHELEKELENE